MCRTCAGSLELRRAAMTCCRCHFSHSRRAYHRSSSQLGGAPSCQIKAQFGSRPPSSVSRSTWHRSFAAQTRTWPLRSSRTNVRRLLSCAWRNHCLCTVARTAFYPFRGQAERNAATMLGREADILRPFAQIWDPATSSHASPCSRSCNAHWPTSTSDPSNATAMLPPHSLKNSRWGPLRICRPC